MRVWDIEPKRLCREHLLGQHREIHAIYSVITKNRKGYASHPEVIRWKTHLSALINAHDRTASEMLARGYKHLSPLPKARSAALPPLITPISEQIKRLKDKKCDCRLTDLR